MTVQANTHSIITITKRIKAGGLVGKGLLNRLEAQESKMFGVTPGKGRVAPNDTNSVAKCESQELELIDVKCELNPERLNMCGSKAEVVLAALRHLQRAVESKEDLSYLSDIIDPESLRHSPIDPLCEEINLGLVEEHYQVAAMSTSHLTEEDRDALIASIEQGEQMVLQRQAGFFLKLYAEGSPENYRHGVSDTLSDIIRWAVQSGYRMIEFDADADVLPQFPVFEW